MIRVNRLFKLSPSDWIMLVLAYRWLLWARWQMRSGHLVGREWLEGNQRHRAGGLPEVEDADDPRIRHRVWLIGRAARYPRHWSWCLQSSLAPREWLAQSGVFADLRIGVKKQEGQLQAHAWLEYKGQVLNDNSRAVEEFVKLQSNRRRLLGQMLDPNRETVQ